MNPNLSTSFVAIQTERELRLAQLERAMLAAEVSSVRSRHARIGALLAWIGETLVHAGQRLQGLPNPAPLTRSREPVDAT